MIIVYRKLEKKFFYRQTCSKKIFGERKKKIKKEKKIREKNPKRLSPEKFQISDFFARKNTATNEVINVAIGSENQIASAPKISGKIKMKVTGITNDCMKAIQADKELSSSPVKYAETKMLNPYSRNISEQVRKTFTVNSYDAGS